MLAELQVRSILAELLAFDSVSSRSNLGLLTYVADLLRTAGIAPQIIADATGTKANLFATTGPADRGGVLLSGHTDVVPVEGQDWTVPPFALTERDGRYYGRGAADMKGFVACAVAAMIAAARRDLAVPLHLALSFDEEVGCIGVHSLIDMLKDAPFRPRFCIVGEPTGMQVATGHKGKIALRATCTGRECHSALAPLGLNALHLAADFIGLLRRRQAALQQGGVTDSDYDVPYTTLHAGRLNGGVQLNIVPNLAVVEFEIRAVGGQDTDHLIGQLRDEADALVAPLRRDFPEAAISIEVEGGYPGLDTPTDAAVVKFVQGLTGANGTIKVAFGTEGGLFSDRLAIPTVICGPGSMAQGHKPDEFVTVEQIARCIAMLDKLVGCLETGGLPGA